MLAPSVIPEVDTAADLLERLGNIPLNRILMRAPPGTATEEDAIALLEADNKRLVELVDGVLVEKPMSNKSSQVGMLLARFLGIHLETHDTGTLLGPDGAARLMPGLIRVPDLSYIRWDKLPGGELPDEPLLNIMPDLAVEVLSPSNTKREMERKLDDYFAAGVSLVWIIDPKTETAEVYTARDKKKRIGKDGKLDGGDVLPGFSLPLKRLFARTRRKPRKG